MLRDNYSGSFCAIQINTDIITYSQQMRAATRNIHNVSDALVNAKLGVTMSDDSVWAEGI